MRFIKLFAICLLFFCFTGCFSNKTNLVKMLQEKNERYISLEEFETAIKNGADVNARNELGESFLGLMAMKCPDPKTITAIIQAGANVNDATNGGFTPLMRAAAFNKNTEIMKVFLDAGADINARNENGSTPLMCAADEYIGRSESIIFLLEHGADPDVKDARGVTVLGYIQRNKELLNSEAFEMLVKLAVQKAKDKIKEEAN
ncbi:MAG: ankyrin repeat domain-containing protein [Candidatus Riflebacteria bacterium]|nr:ankyrin repeat domain-containing protein [Candidatus Riflebacteria bacterium]